MPISAATVDTPPPSTYAWVTSEKRGGAHHEADGQRAGLLVDEP